MPEWLTIDEAAEYLKCSRSTIYRRITDGDLKLHKSGKLSRVLTDDLDQLLIKETGGLDMNTYKNFWANTEKEASARGIDFHELAAAAGAKPGERVSIDQAFIIKKELSSAGPAVSIESLTAEV